MKVLFEGGPHDGGILDVDSSLEYVRLHAPAPRTEYNPDEVLSATVPTVRVYTYKRWRIKYPGDGRVEIRYCLVGRKPLA